MVMAEPKWYKYIGKKICTYGNKIEIWFTNKYKVEKQKNNT
jgi:hypothetical protein